MLAFLCQVRIWVGDNGSPQQTAVTVARVTVQRNLNPPRFTRTTPYAVTILEIQELGRSFITVEATDDDTVVRSQFFFSSMKQDIMKFNWCCNLP